MKLSEVSTQLRATAHEIRPVSWLGFTRLEILADAIDEVGVDEVDEAIAMGLAATAACEAMRKERDDLLVKGLALTAPHWPCACAKVLRKERDVAWRTADDLHDRLKASYRVGDQLRGELAHAVRHGVGLLDLPAAASAMGCDELVLTIRAEPRPEPRADHPRPFRGSGGSTQ